MVQVDCPETGASRCCPSQVCAGEPGQSLPAHSHRDTQPPPRHFPYPRDETRQCWQPASPLCQHSLPALSKTLWARLQGAQLPCACSRAAACLWQRVWEASSHCSVPAPQGIAVPGTARSHLGSLGQGEPEVLWLVDVLYMALFPAAPLETRKSLSPKLSGQEDRVLLRRVQSC